MIEKVEAHTPGACSICPHLRHDLDARAMWRLASASRLVDQDHATTVAVPHGINLTCCSPGAAYVHFRDAICGSCTSARFVAIHKLSARL